VATASLLKTVDIPDEFRSRIR